MSLKKKILWGLATILIAMQFFQPQPNQSDKITDLHVEKLYEMPREVKAILTRSCYDCHSDNTTYPWYRRFQPVAWYMASHIEEGKRELNFSEFGTYSFRKQRNKFRSMSNQVKNEEMPLSSYLLIHRHANLSSEEKQTLVDWFDKKGEGISNVD
ncbi:heme-binding domain-containing protein [Pedobacter sp.]|uniref:heme-binding domain-containing protein n=1 Tax=Pedobacter sp. TaxID=1411316 RepID=UPI0031D776C5